MAEMTQEQIDVLVATAVEGLKSKNAELLAELKDTKRKLVPDADSIKRLEERLEAIENERNSLSQNLNTSKAELEQTKKNLEKETKTATKTLIDATLAQALSSVGVAPQFLPAVKAMFEQKTVVKDVNGVRSVEVGEKSFDVFAKEWAVSEEGKHFITAPRSGGSGASGFKGDVADTSKFMKRGDFEKLSPMDQHDAIINKRLSLVD